MPLIPLSPELTYVLLVVGLFIVDVQSIGAGIGAVDVHQPVPGAGIQKGAARGFEDFGNSFLFIFKHHIRSGCAKSIWARSCLRCQGMAGLP